MARSMHFRGITPKLADGVDVIEDSHVQNVEASDADAPTSPLSLLMESAFSADTFNFDPDATGPRGSGSYAIGDGSGWTSGSWTAGDGWTRGDGWTGGGGGGGWTGGGGGGWTPGSGGGGWTPGEGWTGGGGGGWTPGEVEDALDALEPLIVTIMVDGVERSFGIIMPADYDPDMVYSAIMTFHGGGTVGTDPNAMAALTGFSSYENPAQFIEVYPIAAGDTWGWDPDDSPYDDIAFIEALAEELVANYSVDPDNLYAAGVSGGGMMVQSLALEVPELFAGYAVVAANMMEVLEAEAVVSATDEPIIIFHGTDDPGQPYDGISGWQGKTIMYGSEESADYWADRNDTEMGEYVALPDTVDDGMSVSVSMSLDGTVAHYVVEGGGHTWPGSLPDSAQDISASELIVDFFSDFGF
ncbi:alpha/beta hydrolase family esterase [Flavimaricola marinus]|uniref:Esterase PHB depolymerase n=1 Tax=Flavimaricola marinus TaxID=1819565 RepID=A0A238LGJ3_9RHOB|nr:PHB depolymerase family esterase [Flavimaricola marinus]SMY08809.1 Esterase PHB depolymerase [Flavimaricola marinus]